MSLDPAWLPVATPLNPAEKPPGSLDPFGALAPVERLVEEDGAGEVADLL
jgi:hypothetical protein